MSGSGVGGGGDGEGGGGISSGSHLVDARVTLVFFFRARTRWGLGGVRSGRARERDRGRRARWSAAGSSRGRADAIGIVSGRGAGRGGAGGAGARARSLFVPRGTHLVVARILALHLEGGAGRSPPGTPARGATSPRREVDAATPPVWGAARASASCLIANAIVAVVRARGSPPRENRKTRASPAERPGRCERGASPARASRDAVATAREGLSETLNRRAWSHARRRRCRRERTRRNADARSPPGSLRRTRES